MGTHRSSKDHDIYSVFYVHVYVCATIQNFNFNDRFSHESAVDFSRSSRKSRRTT